MTDTLADCAIFIVAPRELSKERIISLVKHYLPKGNIVLGIAEEEYVLGFEGQPQFRMLRRVDVQPLVEKIAASKPPHSLRLLRYSQRDLAALVSTLTSAQRVLLINGSWKYTFHNSDAYAVLRDNKVPIKFVSPFSDEVEAHRYEASHPIDVVLPGADELLSENDMLTLADTVATQSFDYSFQTGAVLGRKVGDRYRYIASGFNKVIPYQTYALHHGNSREKHLSAPHDANHYDTIHAEMQLMVSAQKQMIDLKDTTLFINLLPCPNCARTLSTTDVSEYIYRIDHSDGYAADLLTKSSKTVRRIV